MPASCPIGRQEITALEAMLALRGARGSHAPVLRLVHHAAAGEIRGVRVEATLQAAVKHPDPRKADPKGCKRLVR